MRIDCRVTLSFELGTERAQIERVRKELARNRRETELFRLRSGTKRIQKVRSTCGDLRLGPG